MGLDPASEIESAVRAALPHSVVPWQVAARRCDDGAWEITMTHEASNGLVFETGQIDAGDAAASVPQGLANMREVQRVAGAPKLDHPETIAGIRAIVQMFGWSRTEVRAVVSLLEEVGALGVDEAEWFTSSFGEDRPPPRGTAIV